MLYFEQSIFYRRITYEIMIVEEHLEHKYIAIWVANFEKYDKKVQQTIRKIIDDNHKKKIKTVVYSSGTKNLQEQTANLLELAAQKHEGKQEIDRDSIDLFTTLWYNNLIKMHSLDEKNYGQRTNT